MLLTDAGIYQGTDYLGTLPTYLACSDLPISLRVRIRVFMLADDARSR